MKKLSIIFLLLFISDALAVDPSFLARMRPKQPQTISWASPPDAMTVGDADQTLAGDHAGASSGLGLTFSTDTTTYCTIVSNKLHAVAAGTCVVHADQAGDARWFAASRVDSGNVTISAGGCTPPTVASSATDNMGFTITLTMSGTVTVDDGTGFTLSTGETMTYVSGSGSSSLVYSIEPALKTGTTTLSYTTVTGGIHTSEPCDLASFSGAAITNNSGMVVVQNFEGTGYDHGETWTESVGTGGTVDEDDTTATVLRGSQELKMSGGSVLSTTYTEWGSDASEVWAHFKIKFDGTDFDTTSRSYVAFNTAAAASVSEVVFINSAATNFIGAYETGLSPIYMTSGVSTSSVYRVWVHYKAGSGSDSQYSVEVTGAGTYSPTQTNYNQSAAGATYVIENGGNKTNSARRIIVRIPAIAKTFYIDQIYVSTKAITNVPD